MNISTILVDADDVMDNLLGHWLTDLNDLYGTNVVANDVTDWDMTRSFPTLSKGQIFDVLSNDTLWDTVGPVPGAQEVTQRLYDAGTSIYVVTATDYRTCKAKFRRILSLFPWLDWGHVIVAKNKQMVKGDVLIDDNPYNLIGGDYQGILFDRPHNRSFDAQEHGIIRACDWFDVEHILAFLRGANN